MMAILDRRFPDSVGDEDLVAIDAGKPLVLTRRWFVVARRATISVWESDPLAFSEHARYLAFEDIVDCIGGKDVFNNLVREMLDFDFYDSWIGAPVDEVR